jgi:haloacetate dehalogenase
MNRDCGELCMQEVNGIRMHYRHAGDGPLVVLLHGWPQTSHMWRLIVAPLAERYTVLAPDLRGYGRSDAPSSGYDKRAMASDVRALVGAYADGPVALCRPRSWSAGGPPLRA